MPGQPVVAANAPTANPNELSMLMQGYSPQTAVAAQRSQYLAQALASMRQEGQNIRTPVALGSDLLAQALLQRKYGQSMQDFATAARGDQQQLAAPALSWLAQQDGSQQTPPAPQQSAPPAPPASAPTGQTPDANNPPPPPTPQNTVPMQAQGNGGGAQSKGFSPLVLRAIVTEAGLDPKAQRDVASTIMARAAANNITPDQVVQTGGFEGLTRSPINQDPRLPQYMASAAQNVAGAQPGGFDAFYSPKGQAALGRSAPSWASGAPVEQAGGLNFYQTGWHAPAGMAPGRAQTPSGAPAYAPQGQPGPLQVPSAPQGTPTPSPSPSPGSSPSPPGGPASAPPAAASPATGGASAPALYHQPVAPEEIALAKQLLSNPRTYQQGIAYVEQLRERTAAPVKPEMSISREGQVLSGNPWDPTHPNPAANVPGWRGPLPAGWQWSADGKTAVSTAAVQSGGTQQIPGSDTIAQVGPGGKLEPVAKASYGDDQIRADLDNIRKSPEYNLYNNSIAMYNTAIQGAQRPGGLSDAMLKEYSARILSGGVAREFSSNMIDNAQGPLARLSMFKDQILGGQTLTPQARYAILQAMHDQLLQNQSNLQGLISSTSGFAKGKGVDLSPYTSPLMRDAPDLPDVSAIPGGVGYRSPDVQLPGYRGPSLPTLTPQQAAQAPRGTQFRTSDGRVMVKS